MAFPTKDDIDRLIDIQNGDCGFFIIAIYSFIEKYMKEKINYYLDFEKEYNSDKFAQITWMFQKAIRNTVYNGWIPDKDVLFFKSMMEGKNIANDVRHNFAKYDSDEAKSAIKVLLNFFTLVDSRIRTSFEPLKVQLTEWMQRVPPKSSPELDKINAKVASEQDNLINMIHESEEYQKLEKEIKELSNRFDILLADNNASSEALDKLEQENQKLREKQELFNTKFKRHEEFKYNISRMSIYTRTRKDFETSILRLTGEQQKAVDRIQFKQDYIIKGSAGTGKSLVLLKTIEKLLKDKVDKSSVYFITYTTSLVNYNSYIASLLKMGIAEDKIMTADKFFTFVLQLIYEKKHLEYNSEEKILNLLHSIILARYSRTGIKEAEVYEELTRFLWPNIVTKEEYIKDGISRKGMKKPLDNKHRQLYWMIFQELDRKLEASNNWPHEYAKYKTAIYLKEHPLEIENKIAEYIFVDESQDLSVAAMYCIKAVTKYSVVMARDMDQTINQIPLTYSRGGLNVKGTSTTLTTNFRNTILINNVAEKYRMLIPGVHKENNPVAFRKGLPVSLMDLDTTEFTQDKIINLIVEKVKMNIDEFGYDLGNILIVVSMSSDKLITKIINALRQKGLEAEKLKEKDYKTSKKICVSTIQSCKGLDFPVVIVFADDFSNYEFKTYDDETKDKIQRNMLYVACTRAMDELTVITTKNCTNAPINDLKQCITEVNKEVQNI